MNATPAHAAEGHTHLEVARLTALLRHARRRLGLARLLQTLSLGVPATTGAFIALSWMVGRLEPSMAVAGLAATVAAGLVAWFGTPHAGGLAALLDERLRLADRVGTALRVGARTDAVALLIQQDAVAHVSPAGIESAFPLRIHRGTWVACAAVAVSAGLWLVERPAPESGPPNPGPGGGMTVRTSPGAGAATARGLASSSRQDDRAQGQTSPAPEPTPPAIPVARATEGHEGSREGATQTGGPKPTAPEERTATGRGAGIGDSTSRGSRDGGPSGDSSSARGTTAAGGSGDVREAAARGATVAAAATNGRAAGGVRYGRGLDGSATVAGELVGPPPSAAAIRQGQRRAETAIAHEDVPPRYRAFLRDYFRAVQSASEP